MLILLYRVGMTAEVLKSKQNYDRNKKNQDSFGQRVP